jgi:hypothetical protein
MRQPCADLRGKVLVHGICPSLFCALPCSQHIYADLSGNVLMHVTVPELGLHSTQWAVISWARSQTSRRYVTDAKYIYRCVAARETYRPRARSQASRLHRHRCPAQLQMVSRQEDRQGQARPGQTSL